MKVNAIASMILTITMVLLLVVVVVIPIVDNQSESITEYTTADNEPLYKMSKGSASYSGSVAVVSSTETSYTWAINGTNVTLTGDQTRTFLWDTGGLYLTATGGTLWFANYTYVTQPFASSADAESGWLSATFSEGNMHATSAAGAYRNCPYTWVLYPDDSGKMGFYGGAFNVSTGKQFYVAYFGSSHAASAVGTVGSLTTVAVGGDKTATWSASYTAHDTYDAVTSVSMTWDGTEATPIGCIGDVQYNAAVDTSSKTGVVQDIVNLIPLILMVAVVIMAISYIVRRSD